MTKYHELNFTYETTRGDEIVSSTECCVDYKYTPGHLAIPPSYSHGGLPPDSPEIEVMNVFVEDFSNGKSFWINPSIILYEEIEDYFISKLYNIAIKNAEECIAEERAFARAEHMADQTEWLPEDLIPGQEPK